jgi:phage-related protein
VKVKPSPAPRAQAKPNPEAQQNAGDQALQKLSQMSPADRQKALANLPAGKRAQVLKQLQSYQTLSPQAKARANGQLQQLQSLPPKQQNQVRGSLQKFQKLPEERRTAVGGELDRLGAMPADQRAARMSSPEFKSAYSSQERQMMGDISKVLPPGK